MPEMFCPQCGRELELDSGEIRFCRYCGFALGDTKDALLGYSKQKRMGFSIVTWSYALLLIVTLLLHGRYVSLDNGRVFWLLALLIVVSVSFFVSAAVSALKPAMFAKGKPGENLKLDPHRETAGGLTNPSGQDKSLPSLGVPIRDVSTGHREAVEQPRSVTESTTRKLSDS